MMQGGSLMPRLKLEALIYPNGSSRVHVCHLASEVALCRTNNRGNCLVEGPDN